MNKITENDILKIIELTTEISNIRYPQAKKNFLAASIANLTENEKWLLTFLSWHCLFNSRFKLIDTERLCLPASPEENQATFQDFLAFLRRHNNIRISPSRERPLLQFLGKCDSTHRRFYLSLMSKEWIDDFPVNELQTLLDLDSISGEEIYGELEYLKTKFADLKYPISLRKVSPENKLKPYLIVKEPLSAMFMVKDKEDKYKRVVKNEKVSLDLKLSTTPRFVVAGFFDSTVFYPCDYFRNWEECVKYLEGDFEGSYEGRIEQLNLFLNRSVFVHSEATNPVTASNEQEVFDAIAKLAKEGTTDILVSDSDSTRTGKSFRLICRIASGIIDEVQEESVLVWFNGELLRVPYKFEGKEQALLTNPEVLKEQVMDFYCVKIGNTEYYFGKEINWYQPKWRARKLRGKKEWIEKCAMCSDTRHRHANRGVCRSCDSNLGYYYKKYGENVWIPPSAQMQLKRSESMWKSSMLNLVGYKYKGTILVAREDGCWMFKRGGENE